VKSKANKVGMLCTFLLVFFFAVSPKPSLAQALCSVSGRITDTSEAGLPQATVTVTSLETGATRRVETDDDGNYAVLSLPVGTYSVKAEKQGFRVSVQSGLELVVGQHGVVNLQLQVGQMQQSITVSSQLPPVNTTTASVSGVVSAAEVKDLPLNGRSFDQLITLDSGAMNNVSHTTSLSTGSGAGNQFGVEGRVPEEQLFLMNGIEYTGNSAREVLPGGASGQLLGVDAIREFNLLTDNYSAQYGKRAGSQVLVVTQSGSNEIHGTLFEFLRNSTMDARNFFDAPPSEIGRRIPVFQRNQFGAALGGPIRRDKIFLFGNYEGFRQRLGVASVAIVPDANARQGLLPNAQGVPTPVPNTNPGMFPFFALWPVANGPELGGGLAYHYGSPKQSIREDFGTVRSDQNLSSKDSFSEAYTIDDGDNVTPTANPQFAGTYLIRNQVLSVEETHIFSPEKVNIARVGFSRAFYDFNVAPTVELPADLSWFAGLEPGSLNIGGGVQQSSGITGSVTGAGGNSTYVHGVRNLFTFSDDFQWTKGKHQLSFGGWFQPMQDNSAGATSKAGSVSFPSLESFIQGIASNFTAVPDPHELGYRMKMGAWFAEDNINVTHRLTVRIGIRHEFTDGWNEAQNRLGNFVWDPATQLLETQPLVGRVFTQNNAKWLFGPRVGLAWDIFGDGKTALRAGFGTYYDLLDNIAFEIDTNPPYNALVSLGQNVPILPLIPVQPGTPGPPQCGPDVPKPCTLFSPSGVLNTLKTPTVEAWNLSIERQLTSNTSLRIGYVGSHEFHGVISTDLNQIHPEICEDPDGCVAGGLNKTTGIAPLGQMYIPVSATRPNPYLANAEVKISSGLASYNALQVEARRRFTNGLEFRANYSWSKNLDIADEEGNSQATNGPPDVNHPYNPKLDWGPSTMDITNMASVSGSYELPFGSGKHWLQSASGVEEKLVGGWQVNTILTVLSGLPLTPLTGNNQTGSGEASNSDRPSFNPDFSGPIIEGTPNHWFNPNAFILQPSGTFGDVGKGSLRGPGLTEWDFSLFKNTSITEKKKLQFRAEFFNILNHPNFNTPNLTIFSGGKISSSAGVITSTVTTSRQIQLALKFLF
jgi:Carboxypeptidase regulatory-like domain